MHTRGRRDQHIRKTLLRISKKLTRIPTRNQDFSLFSKMPTAEFTSWGLSAHLFEAPQLFPKTQGFHRGCAIRDESPRHFITSPSPHVPTITHAQTCVKGSLLHDAALCWGRSWPCPRKDWRGKATSVGTSQVFRGVFSHCKRNGLGNMIVPHSFHAGEQKMDALQFVFL